jgi:hypothetical protein
MSEISLPAMQFLPRFISFLIFLVAIWLMARFARHLVLRATCECQARLGAREKMVKLMANLAFWSVIVMMFPFLLNMTGFSPAWIFNAEYVMAQVFSYWPVWMILSLVIAGIGYLFRTVPRFYVQVKSTFNPSHREA